MAAPPTYFKVLYDNQAGGNFTPIDMSSTLTWPGGGIGLIITDVDDGTTGKLNVALIAGALPTDGQVLTQGGVTADANGNASTLLYNAYFRRDAVVAANGNVRWDTAPAAPALGTTHSFFFDGQTSNVLVGEVLTFSGGQTAEVITIVSDAGATGELNVRFISTVEDLPADNDTFTSPGGGDGAVNGVVHPRAYAALEIHRFLSDLNDDEDVSGDDDLSMIDPTASDRSTDQIIRLLGNINMDDELAQHMYGGSVDQGSGATRTLYSGLDVQVTSPNADTIPVLIQYDPTTGVEAVISPQYWENGYMGDPIAGGVRLLRKTIDNGVPIDGGRIKGKLLEYGDSYFEGNTIIGTATTALALFASTDGNNQTAEGTVAGAPYNTVVFTEGFQTLDYNNGNGATPFGLSFDVGSATKAQSYERTKYIQRRGTAETLFGRNAQLITGINRNFPYDTESANFAENTEIAWGTRINYENEASGPFTNGEAVSFAPSGARGRMLLLDDDGTTGVMIIDLTTGTPTDADSITGALSGATADVAAAGVTIATPAGTGLLIALDDQGTDGNMYYQELYGSEPVDNQVIYQVNTGTLVTCAVNGSTATRTINNQFIGNFTGSDFQTNFGIGLDPSDAQVNDQLLNLLGVVQQPPNNQQGVVTGLVVGDRVSVFPWDGSTLDVNGDPEPDFDQMQVATSAITAGSTSIEVGSIPDNTPAAGFLRLERDSDSNFQLLEYSSISGGDTFNLVGTAGVAAAIGNNVFLAYIDKTAVSTSESYTAVFGPGNQNVAITVRRGTPSPIKTFKSSAVFGATGFSVAAIRTSDA